MLEKFLTLTIFLLPTVVFASQPYLYCQTKTPTYVYPGDSMPKVIQECGEPINKTQKQIHPIKIQKVNQWAYDYQPNSGFSSGGQMVTKKKALVINFADKKVSSIYVLNKATEKTNYCNPQIAISIGDSMLKVDQVCFYPNSIKDVNLKTAQPTKTQITLTFQPTEGASKQKLYFVDNKLVRIGAQ